MQKDFNTDSAFFVENQLIPVVVPIEIKSEFSATSEAKLHHTRIDVIGHYVGTLLYFIRTAALGHSLLDLTTEHKLLDSGEFRENVKNAAEIAQGLIDQLNLESLRLLHLTGEAPTRPFDPNEPRTFEDLAIEINKVLSNPAMPTQLRNVIVYEAKGFLTKAPEANEFDLETLEMGLRKAKQAEGGSDVQS